MAQFARPDADQAAGSWTVTPLWSKVDEGSDGGDTISSELVANNIDTTKADLRLSDVTDPVSSTDHIIRARWASSSTRDITPSCELWQGIPGSGTLIATLAPAVLVDATEITDTYTLSGAEADNITDYSDLYLRLGGTGFGGGPSRALVVEFCELETGDAGTPPTLKSVSGSLTPSGSLQKLVISGQDGSITAVGDLQKEIKFSLGGSLTAAGNVGKLIKQTLDGSMTAAGDLATQFQAGSSFPTGWGRAQAITIDNTKVARTISGFRIFIPLDYLDDEIVDAGSNSALNGGGDIRFSTDAAGTNQIACQVESFITSATPSVRRCQIWVLGDVNVSVDTVIHIWYKKAGEVQPAVGDAFGRNAVWVDEFRRFHMTEAPNTTAGGYIDSAGNGNGTGQGMVTANAAGPFDGDVAFGNGVTDTGDHIETGFDVVGSTYKGMSSWVNSADLAEFLMWGSHDNNNHRAYLGFDQGDVNELFIGCGDGFNSTTDAGITLLVDTWYLQRQAYDGTTCRVYLNGVEAVNFLAGFSGTSSIDMQLLGREFTTDTRCIEGGQAECSFPKTFYDEDWALTEYNNQGDAANFASAGTPFTPGGPTVFDQAVGGSMTPSGAITKSITKLFAGSMSVVGSLVKMALKGVDGASTPSGDLSTLAVIMQAVSGSSMPAGSLRKQIEKKLFGSVAAEGSIRKQISKLLVGSMTVSGSLQKRVEKVLDGSLTPSGTVATTVVILLQLGGQIVISGALATLFIAGVAVSKFLGKILKPILRPILKRILKSHEDE